MTPRTDWTEDIRPDETQRQQDFAEQIALMQKGISAAAGPGRAFHRRPVAGLRGRLRVLPDLPDYAAHGLFAMPGEYEAVVRLSNGAPFGHPEQLPDARGFALSVRGLAGAGARGGTTDRQDFLLINWPSFGVAQTRDVVDVSCPVAHGKAPVVDWLVKRAGPVRGAQELGRVARNLVRPFTGFATTSFHSCAAVAWGPYAAQVHVEPVNARIDPLAWRDFGRDIRRRLAKGPLSWQVQAQFYTDPHNTPIEDARPVWKGERIAVAVLECDGLVDVEQDRFDPWNALAGHRPLGEMMRARRIAYPISAENRGA